MNRQVDVLIVGGGMVGATLARALASLPLSHLVIDAVEPIGRPAESDAFDRRVTALANGSQRILSGIGFWDHLAKDAQPIETIHVSDQGGLGFARLKARDEGVAALGYTIENSVMGDCLFNERSLSDEHQWWAPARLEQIEILDAGVIAKISKGGSVETVRARLVIAADGSSSQVRGLLGLTVTERRYDQTAIVLNLAMEQSHGNRAFERFTRNGPLAMLPLVRERMGVIWTLASDRAEAVSELPAEEFGRQLGRAFGSRLGRIQRLGERGRYPLTSTYANSVVGPRAVLVGNAANTLHPVAGQGFNLALRDVAALAELLADCAAANGDPGNEMLLRGYREWRGPDHRRVRLFTEGLIQLFGRDEWAFSAGRAVGLFAFDVLPGAKAWLAKQTMGLAGRLPKLARGVSLIP